MEEILSSPTTATTTRRKHDTSATSRMKKCCLSFLVSLQEGFTYVKALFVGQVGVGPTYIYTLRRHISGESMHVKKMTAKNEKQAAAAELEAEKMQVEAADEAENTKKRLEKSL